MAFRRVRLGLLNSATAFTLALVAPAFGQDKSLWFSERWPPVSPPASSSNTPPSAKPTVQAGLPNPDNMLLLIRTSLLTLNDAIQTGNFTVLRDRLAPSVRDQNPAHQLYRVFARILEQRIDLRATAILTPEMTDVPAVDGNGRLSLKGVFRAPDGTGLSFHLLFEPTRGQWMLYGATVDTVTAPNVAGAAPQTGAQRTSVPTPPPSAPPPAGRNSGSARATVPPR
jgi:hypothetical protein